MQWQLGPGIRQGVNVAYICSPVSHVYFFVGGCQNLKPNGMESLAGFAPGSATE